MKWQVHGTSWSSYIRFRYDIIKIEFRNLILIILNFDTVIRVRERCNYWKRERAKERRKERKKERKKETDVFVWSCWSAKWCEQTRHRRRVEKDRPKIEKQTVMVEGGPISISHCFRRLRDVKPTTKWSNYSYRKRTKAKSDFGSFVRHRHVINLDWFYSSYFSQFNFWLGKTG
jgi:hypothetical protein